MFWVTAIGGCGLWSILPYSTRQWRSLDIDPIFLLTYKEVGSGRRQSKLLFHVLGHVGDLANDSVKPQNAPTKKQAVDYSSQQTL